MAKSHELPPENISSFIDQVLKAKDPAAVGLKRILKKNDDEQNDYPLRSAALEDFHVGGGGAIKKLSPEDRHVLELEKRVADLQIEMRLQSEKSVVAIQAAYSKGKNEGREIGRVEGTKSTTESYEKKIDSLQQKIGKALQMLESSKKLMLHDTEHILLHLCMEMTKKVVRREVEQSNDVVLSVLKHALSYIGHHDKMVLRVAPGDFDKVSGRKDFWVPVGERLNDISIEQDPQVEPGGCILDTNSGRVDARIGVQISELEEMLEKTWNDIHSAILAGVDNEPGDR